MGTSKAIGGGEGAISGGTRTMVGKGHQRVGSWPCIEPRAPINSAPPLTSATDLLSWMVARVKAHGLLRSLLLGARTIRTRFTVWCGQKGDNGGLLTNGTVLLVVIVQMLLWWKMEFVSMLVAKLFRFPKGRRRPDVSSWTCRIIGWLVENGAVLTLCNLRSLLPHPQPISTEPTEGGIQAATAHGLLCIARNIGISVASNLIAEQGSVLLLHLTSTKLYPQVQPFQQTYKDVTPYRLNGLLDWLRGNAILQLAGGGLALGMIESFMPKQFADELSDTEFSFCKFLGHFGLFRLMNDCVFYIGHRAMHVNPWLYKMIHKR